jgi:hypothetical protein
MNLHQLVMLFAAASVFVIASCSSGQPSVTEVYGVLLRQGKPVSNASVNFTPPKGKPANGVTDSEGHFQLTTFKPGDGAVVGEHVVTVVYIGMEASPIPAHYSDPKKSGLVARVEEGGINELQLELVD